MNCIPKEIFEPQDFLENLTCFLGKGIIRDPVALPCQHVFCRKCIEHALSISSQCPMCSEPATVASIKPQLAVAELINLALVKCPQCSWTGDYQSYCFHEQKCSPATVACPQGCGLLLKRTQVAQHLAVCRFRKTVCKDCKAELMYQELLLHEDMCPERIIDCPNHCGTKLKQGDKLTHLANCKAPKGNCTFSFFGCRFNDAGDAKAKEEHSEAAAVEHLALLGGVVAKLKTRVDVLDKVFMAAAATAPARRDIPNICWSNSKKMVNGDRSGWSFFLSNQPIMKNFLARIKIGYVGSDSNTWKICLGLFNSKQFQQGSWEKYKNGYGYIMGNGCKVHEGGPQSYGQPYSMGDVIGIEHKDGNITFYCNQKPQGIAYTKISGPFYLAVALSDMSHQVEILDVTELD